MALSPRGGKPHQPQLPASVLTRGPSRLHEWARHPWDLGRCLLGLPDLSLQPERSPREEDACRRKGQNRQVETRGARFETQGYVQQKVTGFKTSFYPNVDRKEMRSNPAVPKDWGNAGLFAMTTPGGIPMRTQLRFVDALHGPRGAIKEKIQLRSLYVRLTVCRRQRRT